MPFIHIRLTGGKSTPTVEQKKEIISGVTDLIVRISNKNPATTFVIIEKVPTDNWGIGGKTITKVRRKTAE